MNKPFALIGREFGRGKPFAKKCNTLVELAAAVKEQWQGADYIDGDNGFHTDYSTTYNNPYEDGYHNQNGPGGSVQRQRREAWKAGWLEGKAHKRQYPNGE